MDKMKTIKNGANMSKLILVIFGWLALGMPVQAASFDCGKAASKVEKLICGDDDLSKLDDELGKAYKEALSKANEAQKQRLVTEQKHWLKQTRNICTDESCFKQAYSSRLAALTTSLVPKPPAQGSDWAYQVGEGKKELLCRVLSNRLNHYERERPDTRCSTWDELASYPKFTEPAWEELDPKTHEKLLTMLLKYERGDHFQTLPKLEQQKRDSVYRNLVKDFIQGGGHLRVWRTKPAFIYGTDDGPLTTPTEEQTFVQMGTEPEQTTLCVGTLHPPADWMMQTYVVTPDLSALDPNFIRVKPGIVNTNALLVNTHGLFIYEGKPILVGTNDIWRFSSGSLERICNFQFVKGKK